MERHLEQMVWSNFRNRPLTKSVQPGATSPASLVMVAQPSPHASQLCGLLRHNEHSCAAAGLPMIIDIKSNILQTLFQLASFEDSDWRQ